MAIGFYKRDRLSGKKVLAKKYTPNYGIFTDTG